MAFNDIAKRDGLGRVLRCDVSLDGFATVAYRWADRAGSYDGANMWSRRIASMSDVRRGLGNDRIATSASVSLVVENADGGVDGLCGRENIANAASARFRLYVGIYVPSATLAPADIQWKQLGEFICSEWPRQNNVAVSLQLADDFAGRLGSGLSLPTIADWQAVGTTANNPTQPEVGLPEAIALQTPIQLAFGEDYVQCLPHLLPWGNLTSGYEGMVVVPICATTDLSAVSQDLVESVAIEWLPTPQSFDQAVTETEFTTLPKTGSIDLGAAAVFDIWRVEKSPTITKNGKQYQIVYLVVRSDLGKPFVYSPDPTKPEAASVALANEAHRNQLGYSGGYPADAVDGIAFSTPPVSNRGSYKGGAARVVRWFAKGRLSAITNAPTPPFFIEHSVDAARDLVSVYSSATVDAAQFTRVRAGMPFAACSGVVQPWTERANNDVNGKPLPLSLRQVLTALAQSGDFDLFVNWSGQVSVSADIYDFVVASSLSSLLEISETEAGVERWVPSEGQRGAAYNRVFFDGGKPYPVLRQPIPFQGPFDIAASDVPITARPVEMVLQQGWRPYRQQALNPAAWRNLDGKTRDRVRISLGLSGLRLELGDFFRLNWTRGSALGGPYSSTIFQCESITYRPSGDVVEIEAVWRDDAQTERQYLLDNEALLVRSKGALSGACTESLAEPTWFEFGGTINLSTMGVQPGDILVLRDSTEAAGSFVRNTSYRVVSIPNPTAVEVERANPGVGTSVANADWYFVRGATTYPTAISDPSNYPSGGELYGKVTSAGGTTSNAATGNRLING